MPYQKSEGKQCVVVGCTNNQKKKYQWNEAVCDVHKLPHKDCPCLEPFRFYCIPKDPEKQRLWLKALNRKDFKPSSKSLVCSIHFADGQPTKENPVPMLCMGYEVPLTPARRPLVRKCLNLPSTVKTQPVQDDIGIAPQFENLLAQKSESRPANCKDCCCFFNKPKMIHTSSQTIDVARLDHAYFFRRRSKTAATQHTTPAFSVENVDTDSDARFYTGLNLAVMFSLISTLMPFGKKLPFRVKVPDQIFFVLVRLKLGLSFQDLARRATISAQLMSDIFHSWIDIMAKALSDCVVWLPRETIRALLPKSFKDCFPNTTCITDCSEIFIQRPFKINARAKTWSTYKNNNTAKFLVAIAPNGYIMFVSVLYGGRASDVYITKNSGFLNYLLPGDEVMADRGFTISEELCARRVKLNIPAFMKGREQLSVEEVIDTRRIATNRIHVERAIMRMKSFQILNTKLSTKALKQANKTLLVVAALCNLKDNLIKDEESD